MVDKTYKKPEDYIYASTRVRIYAKRLLSAQEQALFLQADSYEEGMRLLNESAYGSRLDSGKLTYEDSLAEEAARLRRELEDLVPNSPLLRLISLDDLYHDLKVLVKLVLLDQDLEHLLVPVEIANLRWLENLLRSPLQNPKESMEEQAIAEVIEDYAEHRDPERLELIIDKALYRDKLKVAKELNSELISSWLREQIDFINLTTYLRMKRVDKNYERFSFAFIDGGNLDKERLIVLYNGLDLPNHRQISELGATDPVAKAWDEAVKKEQISLLEKARDERSLEAAELGKKMTYGPEVLFAYYLARSIEIQNLRTLMIALRNNMPEDRRLQHIRVKA